MAKFKKKPAYGINNLVITPCFLGSDAELKYTKGGSPYLTMSIGYDDSYSDKNGEVVDQVYWYRGVMWGKQTEKLSEFLKKGTKVSVSGKLVSRKYEEKTITEIVIGAASGGLSFLPNQNQKNSKVDDDDGDDGDDGDDYDEGDDVVASDEDDDEIPF